MRLIEEVAYVQYTGNDIDHQVQIPYESEVHTIILKGEVIHYMCHVCLCDLEVQYIHYESEVYIE